jgi:hypothetical protein
MRLKNLNPFVVLILISSVLGAFPAYGQEDSLSGLLDRATRDGFTQNPDLLAQFLATTTETSFILAEREPSSNQQIGASSSTAGTTTLTEKPGIADLLNLAIERGAITKKDSGSSFTLQTTPYMLITKFGGQDNATEWDRLAILRKIGLSASFAQSGSGTLSSGDFESGELKLIILGSRSPRDQQFRNQLGVHLTRMLGPSLAASTSRFNGWVNGLGSNAEEAYKQALVNFAKWQHDTKKPIPQIEVVNKLQTELERLRKMMTGQDIQRLNVLIAALNNETSVASTASEKIKTEVDQLIKTGPELSLAGSYQRSPEDSDFYSIKLLGAYNRTTQFSLNVDAELMLNASRTSHDGTPLDRTRAYSFDGGFTYGKFAHDAADLSLTAKLMRPQGSAQDMQFAQLKLNLYLARGVTVPIALTYANRTEDSPKSSLRLNVGFSVSADNFMGAARGAS